MSLKRSGIFFVLVLALTLVDYVYLGRPHIGVDDANIFFRYAQNIAGGHGFVFNPGGEKVEGFTSLLWTLVCAAFFSISTHPEWLILFLALLLTTATVSIVYEEVRKDVRALHPGFERKYFLALYCGFIVCIGPSFIAWSVLSLMENPLWNFLFTLITILTLQAYRRNDFPFARKILLILAGILLILTRPEGLAWSFIFGALFLFTEWKNKRGLLLPIAGLLLFAVTAGSLTYFREHYFGYPFPNTYYAKVSGNRIYNIKNGLQYAFGFLTDYQPLITLMGSLLIVTLLAGWRKWKLFRRGLERPAEEQVLFRMAIVSVVIGGALLIPFTTGGDHFGAYRFYQGILLLFAWGFPAALWLYDGAMNTTVRKSIAAAGTALLLFFCLEAAGTLYNVKNNPKTQLNFEFSLAADGRNIAEGMNRFFPAQKPAVGVITVGGFALKYEGNTIDLMGLNNTLMGHSKGDRIGIKNHAAFNKDVFYQLHADLVLPQLVSDTAQARLNFADLHNTYNFDNQALKNIFNDSAFVRSYTPVVIARNDVPQKVFVFASKEFYSTLQKDSALQVWPVTF